jgi:hypothetical protein
LPSDWPRQWNNKNRNETGREKMGSLATCKHSKLVKTYDYA